MERAPNPFYDSHLLSEIHTLFPALLYDHTRFRTIQDVFRYVREQLRARYDVYSNAAREFQNSEAAGRATNTITTSRIPVVSMNIIDTISQVAISDLIRSIFQGGGDVTAAHTGVAATNINAAPIPTISQIQSATRRFSQVGASESPCAVCQDSITNNDVVRKIMGCEHVFHDDCITLWFQRSPLCPNCRYDIVSGTTGPTGPTGPTSPS